jgi:hypothetical protein
MLRTGGAIVSVAGFRRAGSAAPDLGSDDYYELGETFDARFLQRTFAIARAAGSLTRRMRRRAAPDVIVARNLEMLFLAVRLRRMWGNRPAIVYECLDIHRLMLRSDFVGESLRHLERKLARDASLVLISSPAFAREYFDKVNPLELPIRLVENKVFGDGLRGRNPGLAGGEVGPVRIGWFGALRCRRSLDSLGRFALRMGGAVEVVLRGRPALTEFSDFHGAITANPHLSYRGSYRNPADLASIYGDVHLAWAIDYFEAGQNSNWLLPNRVYEGCLNGAIPVALAGTETAALLRARNIGIILDDTDETTLVEIIGRLTPPKLRDLAAAVASVPMIHFASSAGDCRALVADLVALTVTQPSAIEVAA